MKRNDDPNVIVMDREMYESLVRGASSHFDLNPVIHHVRRFNPHYNEEWKRRKAALAALQKEQHQKVRELVRRKLGKYVYIRHGEGFIPARVLGRGLDDKGQVRVHYAKPSTRDTYPFPPQPEPGNYDVDVDRLVDDYPEGFQLVVGGKYKGMYMFAYDPSEPA